MLFLIKLAIALPIGFKFIDLGQLHTLRMVRNGMTIDLPDFYSLLPFKLENAEPYTLMKAIEYAKATKKALLLQTDYRTFADKSTTAGQLLNTFLQYMSKVKLDNQVTQAAHKDATAGVFFVLRPTGHLNIGFAELAPNAQELYGKRVFNELARAEVYARLTGETEPVKLEDDKEGFLNLVERTMLKKNMEATLKGETAPFSLGEIERILYALKLGQAKLVVAATGELTVVDILKE